MSMVKVYIVDHRRTLVDGIYSLIDKSEFAVVLGIFHNLKDCLKELEKNPPDVLLTELTFLIPPELSILKNRDKRKNPYYNGIDFCEEVKKKYPQIKIVVLTGYNNWKTIRRVLDNGVSGYVLKTSPVNEVLNMVDKVMDEENCLCPKSLSALRKGVGKHFFWLTVGEQVLLRLIAEDYTNEEIAEILCYAHETIKSKRKFLLQKFEGGTISMLKEAMQMGLIWEDLVP